MALAVTLAGCVPPGQPGQPTQTGSGQVGSTQKPAIEVSPLSNGEGDWKVVDAGEVTFTITAPGAESAKIFYRPTAADESRYVRLRELAAPSDAASGKFTSKVSLPSDFVGEVWAELAYAGGRTEKTEPVALRTRYGANGGAVAGTDGASQADPAVSARSDRVTQGKIEKAELAKGAGNLRITMNVPAFQLTLWQDGKEIKTWPIGVGLKEFPLPHGNRTAKQVILNPDWIPPDSEWVGEMKGVEPGETYTADDPKNPLGKIKIPLGDAILIHEAVRASDIGNLVSHGCARMTRNDLFELTKMIAAGQGLSVTEAEIEAAKKNDERKDLALKQPIPVEIAYDTAVVEGGKLHLYPDVYDQKQNTPETVRQELQASNVDAAGLDDAAIKSMLEKVSRQQMFVVDVAAIQAGNAVASGQTQSITGRGGDEKKKEAPKRSGSSGRRRS